MTMIYRSTRGNAEKVGSAKAIIRGIAEDKGLYVPDFIPELDEPLSELVDLSYHDIALKILPRFLSDFTEEELRDCIEKAYDAKFSATEIVPVVQAGDAWFIELYHGKTSAFKDMALSILPHLLTTALKKEKEDSTIAVLTATSGDTGKAALEGFADVPGTEIFVFFPQDGVSQIQARQMVTQEGENTHVYGINGNFDDAQTAVKRAFNDLELAKRLAGRGYRLSSANSINIGRLVPQIVYYFWAYLQLLKRGGLAPDDPVNIVVPTGNFGNILAAYYASEMGLPVKRLICASNINHVLTDFINTGIYNANRPFCVTSSPSMDILISSNLERLLYHLSGKSETEVSRLMEDLEQNGLYEVSPKIRKGLEKFRAGFADDAETLSTIKKLHDKTGYLIDPHTAVAYKVYQDYRMETGDDTPTLIASTASAYKFAESVTAALELKDASDGFAAIRQLHCATGVAVPVELETLEKKPVRHKSVIDKEEIAAVVDAVLR
ncbi:MAG TPA: threonine synthase [Clostridiales bacterium]|nr:threonine synthase [Clostridiales bacterium]